MPPVSNFQFLAAEWPSLHEAAARAEALVYPDARSACFYARHALERAVHWVYEHDPALKLPYQDHLSALIHEPTFRAAAGPAVFTKAKVIKDLGNHAVHSHKPVRQIDALTATRELFHVLFWLARTYARGERPADGLAFDAAHLPRTAVPPQTQEQLQRMEAQLREREAKLQEVLSGRAVQDEELKRLRAEVAEARRRNAERPDAHDYSEAETRDFFIDLLLKEAGWALDGPHDREFPVQGMPDGDGRVDYVLWGDDGRPLAIVEAKRARRDPRAGQQQARLYADALQARYGQRPVIFYSNGYDHWLWDDTAYPPRPVAGFYKKDELEALVQRRASRRPLADAAVDEKIVERYYQTRAIRRIAEAFERDRERKALVVMATGAGKTRTVIALCELLMRCNWAKRVLFLADRKALVKQAADAFKAHLPESPAVNLVTEKKEEGRVFVSTYPTMMGLIDDTSDGRRRFGPGHFDLVIIDEAHRSVYQKYRAIFEYFDSLLVGLTATPKDEIDRNTYGLFDLETGVPTDAYPLEEAVRDGYLVPMKAVSVPLRFARQGIRYDDLPEDEKEAWDAAEWSEDGNVPDRVEADDVNRWLFNEDTVDKVLEHLMTRGLKVAGGDRLGKTIIFARNHRHAEFIGERFDANYPHLKGEFARVIDSEVDYADKLIEDFSNPEKSPHIAISVDMLDTGIDVPEVVNLVFFKIVRSKTKFFQMVGRGTRLRPDLFGPGRDKEFFYLFDFCGNLEYFSQDPETVDGSVAPSLGARLFRARLELIGELDRAATGGAAVEGAVRERPASGYGSLRDTTAVRLWEEVSAMNVENFEVRPRRRLVETYASRAAWTTLDPHARDELAREVAGLPSAMAPDPEEARRFDLLILSLQLAVLRGEPGFDRLRDRVKSIAALLESQASIPAIRERIELIDSLQSDEWWQDVTPEMLESVRKKLRSLVRLIERRQRRPIYTDFEDALGEETEVALRGFEAPESYARFRAKARHFLKAHEDHVAVRRLRHNQPLTPTDLAELERMLAESGAGSPEDVVRAREESQGLGLFVRSLVGLDRAAAKEALAGFLDGTRFSGNQIDFVNLMVDHLTEHGVMPPEALYESPYTAFSPLGVEGVFPSADVDQLISVLRDVRQRAVA